MLSTTCRLKAILQSFSVVCPRDIDIFEIQYGDRRHLGFLPPTKEVNAFSRVCLSVCISGVRVLLLFPLKQLEVVVVANAIDYM